MSGRFCQKKTLYNELIVEVIVAGEMPLGASARTGYEDND